MFFEDFVIGTRSEQGAHTFTQEEIIAYAKIYDPHFTHTDPVRAKSSIYGGIIASRFQVTATWMSLMVNMRIEESKRNPSEGGDAASGGPSPGFLEMTWPNPVHPGDTIQYSSTLVKKIDLKSRPNMGIIRSRNIGINQNGDEVLNFLGQGIMQRREPLTA